LSGENKPDPAVELLYENIAALPDPDFGHLNYVPFLHDSDQAKAMKRKISQGVVLLFRDNGYPMSKEESAPIVSRDVSLRCRSCSTVLLKTHVDESGTANVPAATIIASLAQMESECPHKVVTPEQHRRRIEEAFKAAKAESSGEHD
jgi:hypothetical protein